MKKVLAIVALFAVMAFGISTVVAQDSTATAETAQLDSVATPAPADDAVVDAILK